MSISETDLQFANNIAKKACGQLTCIPNGALDLSFNSESDIVPDKLTAGSVWLCRSKNNKVYAVTASHVIDNDDAYLDNYNIIGSHMNKGQSGSCGEYTYRSIQNQSTLFLFTTSKDVRISNMQIYNHCGERLWSLRCNPEYVNLIDYNRVNSIKNNVLHVAYGISADSIDECNNRYGWELTCGNSLKPSCGMSGDPTDLQFVLGSINLDQCLFNGASYVRYQFDSLFGDGSNEQNKSFFVMTRGHKLERWTQNILTEWNYESDIPPFNYGLINAVFPDSKLGSYFVPLQVVGGDHRSDIVIMRPNFNVLDNIHVTEELWDSLDTLKLGQISNLDTGCVVCTIGNPLFALKSTLSDGFIRNIRSKETTYIPSDPIMTTINPISGMSGGPILSCYGFVVGLFSFGLGDGNLNMSGGPNSDVIRNVFNYVTCKFEEHHSCRQINMRKNYFGVDCYDFSVDYLYESLIALITDKEVKGLVVDNIDECGPFGHAGISSGCILINATYRKKSNPCESVTINFGITESEKNMFSLIYNNDIHNDHVIFEYYQNDNYLCVNTACVSFSCYKNHADYYFGDTSYKLTNVVKKQNTSFNKTVYVSQKESVRDAFINKVSVTKTAQTKKIKLTFNIKKSKNNSITISGDTKVTKMINKLTLDPEDPAINVPTPDDIKIPFVKLTKDNVTIITNEPESDTVSVNNN
jgi:hypothetical protein